MAPLKNMTVSDTVTVTSDGRTVVDVRKLFAKPNMQDTFRAIRAKTVRLRRKRRAKVLTADQA
jgi:hypothetical protein